MFPSQGAEFDKVFVFKMLEVGPGSGVDLVKRMQPKEDFENAWIMFAWTIERGLVSFTGPSPC